MNVRMQDAIRAGVILILSFTAPVFARAVDAGQVSDSRPTPDRERSSIVVTGEGEEAAPPDRASIWLGVMVRDTTAESAQAKVNDRTRAVIEAIKKLGVPPDRIQTSHVELSPIHEQSPDPRQQPLVVAYQASNNVRIAIEDLTKVGNAIDGAVKAGANQVNGISFELKNDREARSEALGRAVQDARRKAEIIAKGLGGRLGEVIEAQEGSVDSQPGRPYYRGFASPAALSSAPIESGQVEVRASVTVRFAFKPNSD